MPNTLSASEDDSKRESVRRMFGEIAPNYDRLNAILSLNLHGRWRAEAVRRLALKPGSQVLDLCCGTGDFIRPLRQAIGPRGRILAIDFVLPMLSRAQPKTGENTQLTLGDACQLPLASNAFEGVSVGWGIRNVADIDEAHREIVRVLKPGGRFVSLDMARPRVPFVRAISEGVLTRLVPFLGTLFGNRSAYAYLPQSTQAFRSRDQLCDSMRAAGLTNVGYQDLMLGNVCLHWGEKP